MLNLMQIVRVLLLILALFGVIQLMKNLEKNHGEEKSQSSWISLLLGTPEAPQPESLKRLPDPVVEILNQEERLEERTKEEKDPKLKQPKDPKEQQPQK
jgi:hypothetical protein